MKIRDIIKQAIDIHVHIGPEIIPRKYTARELAKAQKGKIGGFVLKNHFYPTTPFVKEVKNTYGLAVFGSVVLNNSVGGLNPEAVSAASLLSEKPIVVWFPTINSSNFLQKSEFEVAPEWVKKKGFVARNAKDVKPAIVVINGKLTEAAIDVLKKIKECNAILATGHISSEESLILARKAKKIGIKGIVITHPIYQRIAMPIPMQKRLVKMGCFIEQSYSMYAIDKIPIKKITAQIKAVGSKSVILSSDVGQLFSSPPDKALQDFSRKLMGNGVSITELYEMLVVNPKKLLGID